MTYSRFPHTGLYVTNTTGGDLTHGQPLLLNNRTGVAIKDKNVQVVDGFSAQTLIQENEGFWFVDHGVIEVAAPGAGLETLAVGDNAYVTPGYTLSKQADSDEVQKIVVTGTGTYKITVDTADETSALAVNASAAAVQTALEGTTLYSAGDLTVTSPSTGVYYITFNGSSTDDTDIALLEATEDVSGANTVVITEHVKGGADAALLGVVVETSASGRGCPTGYVRVDLDLKS